MPTVAERSTSAKSASSKQAASSNGSAKAKTKGHDYDPDQYRMTLGDHLEELRMRLFLGLAGYVIALIVCFVFGEHVVRFFCQPLIYALERNKLSPNLITTETSESFMVYVKISMICALVLAGPWLLYQLWQFVAAGLYPHERKYVTKYMPFSITLLIVGMAFMYYVVLPITLEFFLSFQLGNSISVLAPGKIDPSAMDRPPVLVPMLHGDPPNPVNGQIWMDMVQRRIKVMFDGSVRTLQFGSDQLINPQIKLDQYIDMVLSMLVGFGLAFQLPLVVLLLVRIGIINVQQLRQFRKYAYFLISIIAAVIVPDVVGGMLALMAPLILLYELGIILGARAQKKAAAAETAT
jgi:sec-independent protein translocase protein TatC